MTFLSLRPKNSDPATISYLENLIKSSESKHAFSLSIACVFINNNNKNGFFWQDKAKRPAASLIKLFILGALAEEIAKGRYDAEKKLTVTDYVAGSGLLKYIGMPTAFTLKELIYLMIVYSDNSATNAILSLITIERVNDFISKLGARNTRIVVPMMPTALEAKRSYNYTTAYDVSLFYKSVFSVFPVSIHQGTVQICRDFLVASRKSFTDIALFLMSTSNVRCVAKIIKYNPFALGKYIYAVLAPLKNKRLSAYIPTEQVIAQKSASNRNIFHDSCIIRLPDGFLCIVSMIECPVANFYRKMSKEYRYALFLTRKIGETLFQNLR